MGNLKVWNFTVHYHQYQFSKKFDNKNQYGFQNNVRVSVYLHPDIYNNLGQFMFLLL